MPPLLETERLILRPFTPADIDEAYLVLESHPDVWKYDPGYQREYDQRAAIIIKYAATNVKDGEGTLAITLKEDGKLIGYVGLQLYVLPTEPLATPEMELYYKLGREWWGRGYALEACEVMLDYAFKEMRITRIVTITNTKNENSLHLMRRLGMVIAPAPPAWPNEMTGTLNNPYIHSD
jgi:RimJ/RimL family protein N-acetyltransferase